MRVPATSVLWSCTIGRDYATFTRVAEVRLSYHINNINRANRCVLVNSVRGVQVLRPASSSLYILCADRLPAPTQNPKSSSLP